MRAELVLQSRRITRRSKMGVGDSEHSIVLMKRGNLTHGTRWREGSVGS